MVILNSSLKSSMLKNLFDFQNSFAFLLLTKVPNGKMPFPQICQNLGYIKKQPLGGTQLVTTKAKTKVKEVIK